MILADFQIAEYCRAGMVTPFDAELVNPASLDLRLGNLLLIESAESPAMKPLSLTSYTQDDPFLLKPGWFVLAQTLEEFALPDHLVGRFALKSSMARRGLEHLLAGFCDPGWSGSVLTMELHNSRQLWPIELWPGMRIGQMVFERMDAVPLRSYAEVGHYNNDKTVMEAKL